MFFNNFDVTILKNIYIKNYFNIFSNKKIFLNIRSNLTVGKLSNYTVAQCGFA
jgi:hypothetical protein